MRLSYLREDASLYDAPGLGCGRIRPMRLHPLIEHLPFAPGNADIRSVFSDAFPKVMNERKSFGDRKRKHTVAECFGRHDQIILAGMAHEKARDTGLSFITVGTAMT